MRGFLYADLRYENGDTDLPGLCESSDFVLWLPRSGALPPDRIAVLAEEARWHLDELEQQRRTPGGGPFFVHFARPTLRIGIFCFYEPGRLLCRDQITRSNLLLQIFAGPHVVEAHPDVPERDRAHLFLALETFRAERHNLDRFYAILA